MAEQEAAAKPSPAAPTTEPWQGAAKQLRDASGWVIRSLAGVGALLATGLGLSSLTKLNSVAQLLAAAAFVLLALLGAGWAIVQRAKVMAPSTVTIDDVVDAETEDSSERPRWSTELFDRKEHFLRGVAASYGELKKAHQKAQEDYAKAVQASWAEPQHDDKNTGSARLWWQRRHAGAARPTVSPAEVARQRMHMYASTVSRITANAGYHEISGRLRFRHQLLAAAIVVIGVIGFALAVAWPTDPDVPADFHGATLAGTNLDGTSLVQASFAGMTLTDVSFRDSDLRNADFAKSKLLRVDLSGALTDDATFKGTTWTSVTCPDGASSDRAGNTCDHHLGGEDG